MEPNIRTLLSPVKSFMKKIPSPIIAILSEELPNFLSHAKLDNLFLYADAPGVPPEGNKSAKTQEWLRRVNERSDHPLDVLGKLIESFMEIEENEIEDTSIFGVQLEHPEVKLKKRLETTLQKYNLRYRQGGHVSDGASAPSHSLAELIRGRDLLGIELEFNRALDNIQSEPREAVSAACNILESIFKFYIDDQNLELPNKQDLHGLWKVVRADLGFNPSSLEDDDLRKIVSGIFSVVDGIGAFRTHASSAHGPGRKMYIIQPRHARLAIHSAHTVAVYLIESWDHKKQRQNA